MTHKHTGARMSHAPTHTRPKATRSGVCNSKMNIHLLCPCIVSLCPYVCPYMCRFIRLPGAEYATASLALDLKPPHVHELHPAVSYASTVTDRRRTSSSYVKPPPFAPPPLGYSDRDRDLWGRRGQVWCTGLDPTTFKCLFSAHKLTHELHRCGVRA